MDTTNTILYRTRKGNEWITFVECMFNGYSLRKSAEIVGVTWGTGFRTIARTYSVRRNKNTKHRLENQYAQHNTLN